MRPEAPRVVLRGIRGLIDGVDDGLLLLFAGRRRLVSLAAKLKQRAGDESRNADREQAVHKRARRLGERLGVPPASSERLMAILIADAHRQQGLDTVVDLAACSRPDLDQGGNERIDVMLAAAMSSSSFHSHAPTWLRWLPPPKRWAPWLRRVPAPWQVQCLEAAMSHVLVAPLAEGRLDPLADRRIGIEVDDLGLRWVVRVRDRRLEVEASDAPAEATVRGSATDLLLLASRREDADTLFFQRRLMLTGDVELGLTARNLLDQLPWEDVPLGLRIVMNRGAGLLQSAREAYRDGRRSR